MKLSRFSIAAATSLFAFMTACSVASTEDGAARDVGGDPSASPSSGGATDGVPSGESGASASHNASGGTIRAGTLTAGVWDDNQNFSLFQSFRTKLGQAPGLLPITDSEFTTANAQRALAPKTLLDVSIVIDTTGSMSDEIRFFQVELDAIRTTIATKYPNAQQRWSLVAYKDVSDVYLTQPTDFTTDAAAFQHAIDDKSAGGGGDFPESPEMGLAAASALQWRTGSDVAKVLFWVADAPHHDYRANEMAAAVRGLRDHGIHVYPVASSGIDEFTELTMRETAQLTNGRYIFLTDDSGVGNSHLEPRVPCFYVTRLDKAITRMIDIEMSGTYREPAQGDVLRTGGSPTNGKCAAAGQEVLESNVY